MKNNNFKLLLLVGLIAIEILAFSNDLKYEVLGIYKTYLYENFEKIKIIGVVIGSILCFGLWRLLKQKEKSPAVMVFLIKALQSKGQDFLGILNIIYSLVHISWVGEELMNGQIYNAILRINFLLLYPLLVGYLIKPELDNKSISPKVLICSLSLPILKNISEEQKAIKEYNYDISQNFVVDSANNMVLKEYFGKTEKLRAWGNIVPIRKSIIKHQNSLEEVILLVSNEVADIMNGFGDLSPQNIIEDFCKKNLKKSHIKIILSNEEPYFFNNNYGGNDIEETGNTIDKVLQFVLKNDRNKNSDLMFHITTGTAISSSAMTLKAIPFDRHAEYVNQTSGIIEAVNLDIFSVKDLWNELIEKVS
jgi:hypothetical protein